MTSLLRSIEPYVFIVFRVAFGALFVFHGLQKLFGMFGGRQVGYLSQLGAAGAIELVAGTLITIGAWTVPVALIASGEMAFAYLLAHLPQGLWPIQNGGELALLYCAAFLYISTHGPGRASVDALLKRR